MSYHPHWCTILYCVSCLLDAADGHAARLLGQTSKFGAVLDMVTDRCVTSFIRFDLRLILVEDVRHRVCFAFFHQPTHHMLPFSNFLLHLILAAITCTCIGE